MNPVATVGSTGQGEDSGRRGPRSIRENTRENNEKLSELPTAYLSAYLFEDPAFAELFEAWQSADSETRADILEAVRSVVGSLFESRPEVSSSAPPIHRQAAKARS